MRRTALAVAVAAMTLGFGPPAADAREADAMSLHVRDFATVDGGVAAPQAPEDTFAPCRRGAATVGDTAFPCKRVDLWSWLDFEDLGGLTFVNDVWGWTDGRRDYVLLGATEGTVFVDITKPRRPQVLGLLPSASTEGGGFWRDIKVYRDHAYVVSEHDEHGLQVFDLTRLRGVTEYTIFEATTIYRGTAENELGHAHNLNINEKTGYAYVVGSGSCAGGLHIVDIRDPAAPAFAGCFAEHGYIHDTQCVIYRGPDRDYRGREICFNSNAEVIGEIDPAGILNALSIVDVTDKANPVILSRVEYEMDGYSHQGWLTPDQGYFLHGDELDELFYGTTTRTRVWDVRDLDDPAVIGAFENTTPSIDHNLYTEGPWVYASNYTSGLRIYQAADVADGNLFEIGYFDVYPENDQPEFLGTWSNYAYFRQKRIIAVSSIDRGLFIVRPRLPGPMY